MKRVFDLLLALILLVALTPMMLAIAVAVRLTSPGGVLHFSRRVGRNCREFSMPKFRTMRTDTPQVATHLLDSPQQWITPLGVWLRRLSLDELPQLWTILIGKMSFVGPRPALVSQDDLVAMREQSGVNALSPGLTGWAQVNGRDELSLEEKAALDAQYLRQQGLWFDTKIIGLTFGKAMLGKGVVEGGPAPSHVHESQSPI